MAKLRINYKKGLEWSLNVILIYRIAGYDTVKRSVREFHKSKY